MDLWQQLQDDIHIFTMKAFGGSTAKAKALHLAEEAHEAAADPQDIIEWADCLILLLGGVQCAGYTVDDLYQAALHKMEINKSRKWGERDENGIARHIE